jgi:hypothetical protein
MGEVVNMIQEIGSEFEQYEASRLRNEEIVYYWPWINEELDRIPQTWSGHWTKDSLYELAMNERFQVWGFGPKKEIRVFVFTQIIHFPANRVLQIFLCFGNSLDEALPIIEATLERFALETSCALVEITGRRGWERKLKNFHYDYTVMTRVMESQGVH